MMNKKPWILIPLFLTLAAGIIWVLNVQFQPKPSASLLKSAEDTPQKLILTYSFAKANQLPVIVAQGKGLFNKYNIAVDIQQVPKNVTSMLVSGKADIMLGTPNIALSAVVEGSKLSWIGSVNNDQALVVIATKNLKDIKTAGIIAGPGRAQAIGLLNNLGLDINKISYQELAGNPERLLALQQKQVDVTNVPKPDWLNFKKKANLGEEYKILLDSSFEPEAQIPIGIIVRNEYLEQNKSSVESFVKALLEADYWMKDLNNKKELAEILQKHYPDMSPEEITVEIDSYLPTLTNLQFTPTKEKGEASLKIIAASNPKAKDYNLNDFINTKIADSLKAAGFLTKLGFN
ncbi:MAG: ABC transporter substrate-binding protein [Microgenomates group bacterium]